MWNRIAIAIAIVLASAGIVKADGAVAYVDVANVGMSGSVVVNSASAGIASEKAIANCRKSTRHSEVADRCKIVATLHRQCAVIVAGRRASAWAVAGTAEEAERRATAKCKSVTDDCSRATELLCDTTE